MVVVRCSNKLSSDVTRFLELSDTPDTYEAQAGKYVVVNNTETGVEFVNISGLNLDFLDDQTVYTCSNIVEVNDLVHVNDPFTAVQADKSNLVELPILGAVVAKPTATSCIIQTLGYLDNFTGLNTGETYFLDSSGKITNVPTTTTGEALYPVGVAKSETRLELRIDSDYTIRS